MVSSGVVRMTIIGGITICNIIYDCNIFITQATGFNIVIFFSLQPHIGIQVHCLTFVHYNMTERYYDNTYKDFTYN